MSAEAGRRRELSRLRIIIELTYSGDDAAEYAAARSALIRELDNTARDVADWHPGVRVETVEAAG